MIVLVELIANVRIRALLYLTVAAATMITINILQAFLIDRLHSLSWILGFPLSVFVVLLALAVARTAIGLDDVRTTWRTADVAERTAWFGVILSVLLPIIICQFVYMPLIAIPAWQTTTWTTSLEVTETFQMPAIVFMSVSDGYTMSIQDLQCSDQTERSCVISPDGVLSSLTQGNWSYFYLSPPSPAPGAPMTVNATSDHFYFNIKFSYNRTLPASLVF